MINTFLRNFYKSGPVWFFLGEGGLPKKAKALNFTINSVGNENINSVGVELENISFRK